MEAVAGQTLIRIHPGIIQVVERRRNNALRPLRLLVLSPTDPDKCSSALQLNVDEKWKIFRKALTSPRRALLQKKSTNLLARAGEVSNIRQIPSYGPISLTETGDNRPTAGWEKLCVAVGDHLASHRPRPRVRSGRLVGNSHVPI